MTIDRRQFARVAGEGASIAFPSSAVDFRIAFLIVSVLYVALAAGACGFDPVRSDREVSGSAALTSRPTTPTESLSAGKHALDLAGQRDGFIYIPEVLDPDNSAPLLVLLHGASGLADNWESAFFLADSLGIVLLAIDSRAGTWDVIQFGVYGPDVAFLDAALEKTFRHVEVDPFRVGVGGFSDGASYALSVGLSNGDLFTHIVAWSPGFMVPTRQQGRPRVFISHGTLDAILSVQTTRTQIVASLEGTGYSVHFEEFLGGHEIPDAIAQQAFDWFLEP